MFLAYLQVCLPLLAPDFCYAEKPLPYQFDTDQSCWEAVDSFMHKVTPEGTVMLFHFRCGSEA